MLKNDKKSSIKFEHLSSFLKHLIIQTKYFIKEMVFLLTMLKLCRKEDHKMKKTRKNIVLFRYSEIPEKERSLSELISRSESKIPELKTPGSLEAKEIER